MKDKVQVRLPKETQAFFCANCGAVALDSNNICKVMGRGKKGDWCGTKGVKPPSFCNNKIHNDRWQCRNCGQISINPSCCANPRPSS